MPRPLRIEYEDAWYHVMNRGINKKPIFKTDYLKEQLLLLFDDVSTRFSAEIHGYCIMGNHYHILMRTPNANLARIMRHIDGVYTQKFHRLQKQYSDGCIFRGRYKAKLIGEYDYLLNVSRYIHLNPVEAHITSAPESYLWSSCSAYCESTSIPKWLTTDEILTIAGGKQAYQTFLAQGNDKETSAHYNKKHWLAIFGSSKFSDQLLRKIGSQQRQASITDIRRLTSHRAPNLNLITSTVAQHCNVTTYDLLNPRKYSNTPRQISAYIAQYYFGYSLNEIASYYCWKTYSAVYSSNRRFVKRLNSSSNLQVNIDNIVAKLRAATTDTPYQM